MRPLIRFLFCVFVVGIVFDYKSVGSMVVSSAKSGPPITGAKLVAVCNPAHHPNVPLRLKTGKVDTPEFGVTDIERFVACERNGSLFGIFDPTSDRSVSTKCFVWGMHRQWTLLPVDHTKTLRNSGGTTTNVRNIKLSGNGIVF